MFLLFEFTDTYVNVNIKQEFYARMNVLILRKE